MPSSPYFPWWHVAGEFEALDLRKGGLEDALARRPGEPLRLVHGCRWLDVKLLSELPALLAPGGYVLWSTFLDPPDGSPPLKPPYRRSRRLRCISRLLTPSHAFSRLLPPYRRSRRLRCSRAARLQPAHSCQLVLVLVWCWCWWRPSLIVMRWSCAINSACGDTWLCSLGVSRV